METILISTLKKELLIIELPENGNTFDDLTFLDSETKGYTLLGTPDEIREEDAERLVDISRRYGHKNYNKKDEMSNSYFISAVDSLLSAIESKIYWENPFKKPDNYDLWSKYGDYTQYGVGLTTDSLKWHEAQENTFEKSRTLVFVKN